MPLAGGLGGPVAVDDQMIFGGHFINRFEAGKSIRVFAVKEIRFDSLDAFVGPFHQNLTLFGCVQIAILNPGNKPDALFLRILEQTVKIRVIAIIFFSGHSGFRLPALIQYQIFPAHFGGQINVVFNGFFGALPLKAFGKPHPGGHTGYDPGIVSLGGRGQIFGQIAFHNIADIPIDAIAPGRGKVCSDFNGGIIGDLRRKGHTEYIIAVCLHHHSGIIVAKHIRFGNQQILVCFCPFIVDAYQSRHTDEFCFGNIFNGAV